MTPLLLTLQAVASNGHLATILCLAVLILGVYFLFRRIGRRLLAVPTVGVKPILKQQNREAILMWCSGILTNLLTLIALVFLKPDGADIQ